MKTNSKITCVILARGIEDVGLVEEINQIFSRLGAGPKEIATLYPNLMELRHGLAREVGREEG